MLREKSHLANYIWAAHLLCHGHNDLPGAFAGHDPIGLHLLCGAQGVVKGTHTALYFCLGSVCPLSRLDALLVHL